MSKKKPKTNTCQFCPGGESFGKYGQDVHKMLWYMGNSKFLTLDLLEKFEAFRVREGDIFQKIVDSEGNPYPGIQCE